ncbi:MAG: hypothetical protein KDJ16_05665 [Hyphomicrobiales bacterium]|nr:hypothetical protein [Hyphomicrobiales bacterium]
MRIAFGISLFVLFAAVLGSPAIADDHPPYDGRKKCSSCHKSQYESWKETGHASALHSLEAGEKTAAKRMAGLDPDKDYTEDKECVGCHVTGYGAEGGYDIDDPSKYLTGVTCESCHGPGSEYRLVHREAGERFERKQETTPRSELADAGEEFKFVERCNSCHMNYKGSPWASAQAPFTPFTPAVDPKYAFDFEAAVRNDKAMHAHFKLEGTFTGEPLPAFHDEFQANAKPIVAE